MYFITFFFCLSYIPQIYFVILPSCISLNFIFKPEQFLHQELHRLRTSGKCQHPISKYPSNIFFQFYSCPISVILADSWKQHVLKAFPFILVVDSINSQFVLLFSGSFSTLFAQVELHSQKKLKCFIFKQLIVTNENLKIWLYVLLGRM